jgi:hypothetical protein
MAAPRIGRPDRIAALVAELETEGALGRPPGMPATTRLLLGLTPATEQPSRETVHEAAARLADLLAPLPAALGELVTRNTRHCAVAGRDAELARAVELVRGDTFALSLAIARLAEAARGATRATAQ